MMLRTLRTLVISVPLLVLIGCSGCDDDEGCPGGCAEGETCFGGQCVQTVTCPGGCASGEECVSGECVPAQLQCATAGESCSPTRPTADGFFCVDPDGGGPAGAECLEECGTGGTCPTGALCFFLESSLDASCASDVDCADGKICQAGGCRDTVCRPSECSGFIEGIETCDALYGSAFSDGATCADVGNGANFCFPAGTRQEGEACIELFEALDIGDFTDTCASGLGCASGNCRVACTDDSGCGEGQNCLLADEGFFSAGVGFCADDCTPFETGSCGAGQTCLPLGGDAGICLEAGTREAFSDCTPGEAGQCEDGTLCVRLQAANPNSGVREVGRCMPTCDIRAGVANPDGTVGDLEQAQRDATCPNPPPAPAGVEFINLAASVGAVDVYFGDETSPAIAGLDVGARSDADAAGEGAQFFERDAGTFSYRVLVAGAPRTDLELLAGTLALRQGEGATAALVAAPATTEEVSAMVTTLSDGVAPTSGQTRVRLGHRVADLGDVDVVLVPEGDDLSDSTNQVELAAGLSSASTADVVVDAGQWDLLVFDAGDPRTNRADAIVSSSGITLPDAAGTELYLAGTVDATDLAPLTVEMLEYQTAFGAGVAGPTYTCVDTQNGAWGFCQQRCEDADDFGTAQCAGDAMGCMPQFVSGPDVWATLCGPVGAGVEGSACNPFAAYEECGEGLYCLEYGSTADGFDAANRGRCTSHCVRGNPEHGALSCAEGMSCQPIGFDDAYVIGQCGFACEPDRAYGDSTCPAGLQSCLPVASLQEDPANPEAPPLVRDEASFCGASGDIAPLAACAGADCLPGTECIYPRSQQSGFINTLLSPYIGGGGAPTCTPICDPFDGDGTDVACGPGETCLFNYPFSAEVGHCAPITATAPVNAGCSNPGEACNEDAICVDNGGQLVCLRFCQYAGGDGMGGYERGTCPSGLECTPLVADIGLCRDPS